MKQGDDFLVEEGGDLLRGEAGDDFAVYLDPDSFGAADAKAERRLEGDGVLEAALLHFRLDGVHHGLRAVQVARAADADRDFDLFVHQFPL